MVLISMYKRKKWDNGKRRKTWVETCISMFRFCVYSLKYDQKMWFMEDENMFDLLWEVKYSL